MTLSHIHHWKIAFKEGEESPALCDCGQTRMFLNAEQRSRPWAVHSCGHPYYSNAHRDGCLSAKE